MSKVTPKVLLKVVTAGKTAARLDPTWIR